MHAGSILFVSKDDVVLTDEGLVGTSGMAVVYVSFLMVSLLIVLHKKPLVIVTGIVAGKWTL